MTKGKRYLFFILLGVALLAGSLLLYLGFTQQRSAPSGGSKFVWREGEERDARERVYCLTVRGPGGPPSYGAGDPLPALYGAGIRRAGGGKAPQERIR